MELLVPMAGLIDVKAESTHLQKEIEKLSKDLPRVESKLNNPKFVEKHRLKLSARKKINSPT
nr:hypothetical protein [Microbulbifer variabilis]